MANLGTGIIMDIGPIASIFCTADTSALRAITIDISIAEKINISPVALGDFSHVSISPTLIYDNLQWGTSLWLTRD